jgi:hypothetical protein
MARNMLTRDLRPEQAPAWSAMVEASRRAFGALIGPSAFPCLVVEVAPTRRPLQTSLVPDVPRRVIMHA